MRLARVGEHADLDVVGADVEAADGVLDEVLHLNEVAGSHGFGGVHDKHDVGGLHPASCRNTHSAVTCR